MNLFKTPETCACAAKFLVAALCLVRIAAAQDVGVTYDDLRAGYWLNYEEFKTLFVSWRHVQIPHENALRRYEEAWKEETPEQIAALRLASGHRAERNELWTDRVAFQVRTPSSLLRDRLALDRKFDFPSHAPRKDNLMSDFAEIAVYNFNGNLSEGIKLWSGALQGLPQGAVLSRLRDDAPGRSLPPLAMRPAIAGFALHPFDAFFSTESDDVHVVGRVEFDGRPTVLVEKTTTQQNGRQRLKLLVEEAGEDINKVALQDVQRAWIDMERGCLPLRMETTTQLVYDGKVFPDVYGLGAADVIETQQIEKIKDGGYYPTKTRQVFYGFDTRQMHGATILFKDMIGAGLPKRKTVPDTEQQWLADVVDVSRNMTGLFGFEFPDSTVYFDFRTLKVEGKNYDPTTAGGSASRGRRGTTEDRLLRLALIGANLLLVIILGAIVAVRRYRGLNG